MYGILNSPGNTQLHQAVLMSTTNSCISKGEGCQSATNYPQFIDSESCLCGFLDSPVPSPNGNRQQVWRCIGDANDDLKRGSHGKWFQPSLPSEELSGINQPQNWGQNPPELSQPYVLVTENGKKKLQELEGNNSPQLIGNDESCTGKNSSQLSTQYYQNGQKGKHDAHSNDDHSNNHSDDHSNDHTHTHSSPHTESHTSSVTSTTVATSTTSATSTASSTPSAASTTASTSSGPAPASATNHAQKLPSSNLKSLLLLTVLIVPSIASALQM